MRILFWFLIVANIVLLGIQTIYSDTPGEEVREPERIANQYLEERIRLLTLDEVSRALTGTPVVAASADMAASNMRTPSGMEGEPAASPEGVSGADAPPAGDGAPEPGESVSLPAMPAYASCVEVGEFNKAEATLFEMQLLALSLNPDNVFVAPVLEGSKFMVHVPPLADQNAADAKVAELQRQGVQNLFIIREQSALRWAISLGVFSSREAAARFVADLGRLGVSGLQVTPRGQVSEKLLYRLGNLTNEQMIFVESIVAKFPRQAMRQCQPTS